MYQLLPDSPLGSATCVIRLSDNAFIPFDPDNTDYQRFKQDITDGVELLDADGNTMTPTQVQDFLETLP